MNGVQTRFKCKLDVKRCKRFVFPPSSLLPRSNALKTKAIRYFQTDRTLTRIVSPPLYATYGGEFEVKVKITGNYVTTFDQMGLMLRIDHENWIKAGVEYVDGKQNVSAVVTHRTSDWSVVQLPDAPRSLWIKAVRRLDAVEIFFSRDDKEYTMMRTCWLQDNCPVMVGLMGACPDGKGFTATFEEFKVTPLADQRRLEWAKKQADK